MTQTRSLSDNYLLDLIRETPISVAEKKYSGPKSCLLDPSVSLCVFSRQAPNDSVFLYGSFMRKFTSSLREFRETLGNLLERDLSNSTVSQIVELAREACPVNPETKKKMDGYFPLSSHGYHNLNFVVACGGEKMVLDGVQGFAFNKKKLVEVMNLNLLILTEVNNDFDKLVL